MGIKPTRSFYKERREKELNIPFSFFLDLSQSETIFSVILKIQATTLSFKQRWIFPIYLASLSHFTSVLFFCQTLSFSFTSKWMLIYTWSWRKQAWKECRIFRSISWLLTFCSDERMLIVPGFHCSCCCVVVESTGFLDCILRPEKQRIHKPKIKLSLHTSRNIVAWWWVWCENMDCSWHGDNFWGWKDPFWWGHDMVFIHS